MVKGLYVLIEILVMVAMVKASTSTPGMVYVVTPDNMVAVELRDNPVVLTADSSSPVGFSAKGISSSGASGDHIELVKPMGGSRATNGLNPQSVGFGGAMSGSSDIVSGSSDIVPPHFGVASGYSSVAPGSSGVMPGVGNREVLTQEEQLNMRKDSAKNEGASTSGDNKGKKDEGKDNEKKGSGKKNDDKNKDKDNKDKKISGKSTNKNGVKSFVAFGGTVVAVLLTLL